MMEFISVTWQVIIHVAALIAFINGFKSLYNNYLKRKRPKLEIDFGLSLKNLGHSMEYINSIRILNTSDETAFRIRLYITNNGNNLIKNYDHLKPAEDPIIHESKASFKMPEDNQIEATNFLNNLRVIVEYRNSNRKIYYTIRKGMNKDSIKLATKKRPKELDEFISDFKKLK